MKETKKEEIELLKLKIRLLELEIKKMELERNSITTTTGSWYPSTTYFCNGSASPIPTPGGYGATDTLN